MKKRILLIILLSLCSITVFALSNKFTFDSSKLSFVSNSKKSTVISNFNPDYNISYSIENKNSKLEEEIKSLTKKTTYLLFGDFNNTNESSENYFKRKKEFYDLRYAPNIPKDPNSTSPNGYDTNSQEYKDDAISSIAIPQIFNQAGEFGLLYSSYGDIRVMISDDIVISSIVLKNAKHKEESKVDPMKYTYVESDFIMYYYYKKLNNDWKLYYLYGIDADELDEYTRNIEINESKKMGIMPSYQSQLSTIYNFYKLKSMTQDELNNIYNENVNNIVYLNSFYNNKVINSANGFFIGNGLIVTSWSFLEKALIEAQYITLIGHDKIYEIKGIVTANPEMDVVVMKVDNTNNSYVHLGKSSELKTEDPAIIISSKSGVGLVVQTGIIISNEAYIQTSIPLSNIDGGSPLFNQKGDVVGINTSQLVNSDISIANNVNVLEEIQNKFSSLNYDDIKVITFEELKEKYYYEKYDNEKKIDDIPKDKWNKYSKIGNIKETIKLDIMKASYQDGIVSLRYKNEIPDYVSSMQLSGAFREQLKKDGYKETLYTTEKIIYKNEEYQIIIMDEFDYLIIVMVAL